MSHLLVVLGGPGAGNWRGWVVGGVASASVGSCVERDADSRIRFPRGLLKKVSHYPIMSLLY